MQILLCHLSNCQFLDVFGNKLIDFSYSPNRNTSNTLLCISDIIHGLNYVEMPGVADQVKRDAERGVCNWSDNPRLVTRFLK